MHLGIVIILALALSISCVKPEASITVINAQNNIPDSQDDGNIIDPGGSEDSPEESSTPPPSSPPSSQNILVDTDNTTIDEYFNNTNHGGATLSQTINSINATNSLICNGASLKSSCIQRSIATYNLPITIEFAFKAHGSYNSGTYCGMSIYEQNDPTLEIHDYGWPYIYDGDTLVRTSWDHVYGSKQIRGFGLLQGVVGVQGIQDSGKMKLEIDVNGNFDYTLYDINSNTIYTKSGTLGYTPTNFTIELYQANYSGYAFEIDNIAITY